MRNRVPLIWAALFFLCVSMIPALNAEPNTFKEDQLRFKRVRIAVQDKEEVLKALFAQKALPYPPCEIFLRAFKQEKILELWVRSALDKPFVLLKTYDICSLSGGLGPKRRQGDLQVPEGFYMIDEFNPASAFYLSMSINYPNASDKILGDPVSPGGEIYIHGSCVTIGCLPLTDDKIKEVYLLALEAKSGGQEKIPVHIFPARVSQDNLRALKDKLERGDSSIRPAFKDPQGQVEDLMAFWQNLKEGYDLFELNKIVPPYSIDQASGKYIFSLPSLGNRTQ